MIALANSAVFIAFGLFIALILILAFKDIFMTVLRAGWGRGMVIAAVIAIAITIFVNFQSGPGLITQTYDQVKQAPNGVTIVQPGQ